LSKNIVVRAIPNSMGICPIHRFGKYFSHEFFFKSAFNCSMFTDYSPSLSSTQWRAWLMPIMLYIVFATMEHAICMEANLRFSWFQ